MNLPSEKLLAAFAEGVAIATAPAGAIMAGRAGKHGGEMTRLTHNWQATA